MKFTVVSPSFNQGKFIRKCLASVRAQGETIDVEHVIYDNLSTDGTLNALKDYQAAPGRVHVRVFVEADRGQTEAINKGLASATGDVVCWLNTDEWYKEGALERVAEFLRANPNVDIAFGDCDFVDAEGVLIRRKREFEFSEAMLIYYGCYLPSCATFIRRKIIDDGHFLNPEFRVAMDFEWYVRLAKLGYRFAHVPAVLAEFTWHETNISSVLKARRLLEGRLVKDRYSGIKGPRWFRSAIFLLMPYVWRLSRFSRRVAA